MAGDEDFERQLEEVQALAAIFGGEEEFSTQSSQVRRQLPLASSMTASQPPCVCGRSSRSLSEVVRSLLLGYFSAAAPARESTRALLRRRQQGFRRQGHDYPACIHSARGAPAADPLRPCCTATSSAPRVALPCLR